MINLCECGCGGITKIAKRTSNDRGHIRGKPLRFMHGHNSCGSNHNQWKGGKYIDSNGYVFIHSPSHPYSNTKGYIREHILVMEKALKRYIRPPEVIHHLDRNRQNNHIGNLILFKSHRDHEFYESRWDAFRASGHIDWMKCWICKKYDHPSNIVTKPSKLNGYHRECRNEYKREMRKCQRLDKI